MSKMVRIAKVIATIFLPRGVREFTSITGDPLTFTAHSQKFITTNEIIDLLKLNIKLEKEYSLEKYIKRDLIIVSPSVKNKEGEKFLSEINNLVIPGGKVLILERENIGMSYGSYSDAFKKYKNYYDYFLFTEDDWLIYGEKYFDVGLNVFKKDKTVGMVAYQAKTRIGKHHWEDLDLNQNNAFTCHSTCGLASTEALNKIFNKFGRLPYFDGNDYFKSIRYGECKFGSSFYKVGYKIEDLPRDKVLGMPAYDYIRKIPYKKYPNYFDKIYIYYIKSVLKRHIAKFIWKLVSATKPTKNLYLKIISKIK